MCGDLIGKNKKIIKTKSGTIGSIIKLNYLCEIKNIISYKNGNISS